MEQHLFFLFLSCFLFICFAEDGEQRKRLLLDDPTVISNRLTRLENSLEILNRTVNQQAMTIQHQATTIQQQATTIQQQATNILQHTTTDQQQASTIQQLELTTHRQAVQTKQLQTALTTFQAKHSTHSITGNSNCRGNPNRRFVNKLAERDCTGSTYTLFGEESNVLPKILRSKSTQVAEELGFLSTICADVSWHVLIPKDQDPICTLNGASASAQFSPADRCPFEEVYMRLREPDEIKTNTGFVGGGMYTQTGSAAEYVCLPPDPDFGKTSAYGGGRMYGAEYQGHANDWSTTAYDEDVPCAVCRSTIVTTTIMIPGKNTCYSGWTLEYFGYLGFGDYGHAAASSYVCVEIHPENLNAGKENKNGKLIFPVVAICGSLQCPPYRDNYPLTCVVCSK